MRISAQVLTRIDAHHNLFLHGSEQTSGVYIHNSMRTGMNKQYVAHIHIYIYIYIHAVQYREVHMIMSHVGLDKFQHESPWWVHRLPMPADHSAEYV